MKIEKAGCEQFAGVRDLSVEFGDGVNVVYGANEAGKSTLVNLISRTLFQNAKLDNIYDSHHPAVLEMIRMTVENGHKGGCWVGICGELGADTTLTEDFLKMGVDELSVTPGSVLPIREIIRNTSVK